MKGNGQWVPDVFTLEDCGEDQPLFHKLLRQHPVFHLPSQVSGTVHSTTGSTGRVLSTTLLRKSITSIAETESSLQNKQLHLLFLQLHHSVS